MKVSVSPAVRISPEAFRRNIRLSAPTSVTDILPSLSAFPPFDFFVFLSLYEIDLGHFGVLQRDQSALQDSFRIDAPGIHADRFADVDLRAPLMDVSVKSEERLVLLDDVQQSLAAGVGLRGQTHFVDDPQIPIEFRAGVEGGAERRHMHIEDASAHVAD